MASLDPLFQQLRIGINKNEKERQHLRRSRDASDEGSQGRQNRPRQNTPKPPEWWYDEVLEYYEDGTTLKTRKHVDSNGKLHDPYYRPALVEYYPSGQVKYQRWATHGLVDKLQDDYAMVQLYAEKPNFDPTNDEPVLSEYLEVEYQKAETRPADNLVLIREKVYDTTQEGNNDTLITETEYLANNVPLPEHPDNKVVRTLFRLYEPRSLLFQDDPQRFTFEELYYESGKIKERTTIGRITNKTAYYESGIVKRVCKRRTDGNDHTDLFFDETSFLEDRWFQDTPGEILHRDGDAPALHIKNGAKNVQRIEFYKNGIKHRENGPSSYKLEENEDGDRVLSLWWMQNNRPERPDQPAIQEWIIDSLVVQEHVLLKIEIENYDDEHGYLTQRNEWYKDGSKIQQENWEYKRDGDLPLHYVKVEKVWYENGSKIREKIQKLDFEEGSHYSFMYSDEIGILKFFRNGVLHREDGPAVTKYNFSEDEMIEEQYWYYGNQYPSFELLQMRQSFFTPEQPRKDLRKEFIEGALEVDEGSFLTLEKYLERTKEEDIDPEIVRKLKEEEEHRMPMRQRAEQAFEQLKQKRMEEEAPALAKARKTYPELNWSMRIIVT